MKKMVLLLAVALLWESGLAVAVDAEYLLRGVQQPVARFVNGYTQSVVAEGDALWRVQVSCSSTPVGSFAPAPPLVPGKGVPESFRLPDSLLQHFRSGQNAWERGTEILRWVSVELKLKKDDTAPQDAASILERGSGRCSGIANATAALFMAAGYEARTVGGLLVTDRGPVPHRWLEVLLPRAGWVPTDPTLGFWVVSPRHIAFSRTVEVIPDISTLRRPPEDLPFPRSGDGLYVRPDRGLNFHCRVVGACSSDLVAVLRDAAGDERRALLRPDGVFSGLLPGQWILEVRDGSRSLRRLSIELKAGEDRSLALKLGCGDPS